MMPNDWVEIREYPPQVRTVRIGSKTFVLQFPYTVFAGTWEDWDEYDEQYKVSLSVGWSKKPITSMYDVIYHPVLPHVQTGLKMCMSGMFDYGNCDSDDLVKDYWCSRFASFGSGHCSIGSREALSANFGRLASWRDLTLEQVTDQLCYGPRWFKTFALGAMAGYYGDRFKYSLRGVKFLKSIRRKMNQTDKRNAKNAGLNSSGVCNIDSLVDYDLNGDY